MCLSIPIIIATFFALPSLSRFVPPPNDLITAEGAAGIPVRYKQVPSDICELDPNVKSYSGYADVAPDQHVFWWFFEARDDPENKPLTLWINGGPGSSSMLGLFGENGPCSIGSDLKPYDNPYSWTNATNMLYIDQPTQVGFSYSIPIPAYIQEGEVKKLSNQSCPANATQCGTWSLPDHSLTANSTAGAAPNFWKTLQGFMGAFPQYAQNDVIFATESYGGHYGPIFSEYIMKQNEANIPDALNISLSALLIGNGWFDPTVQYPAYLNFSLSGGNSYGLRVYNESTENKLTDALYGPGGCVDALKVCNRRNGTNSDCIKADEKCSQGVQEPYELVSSARDPYDMRYLNPSPFPPSYYIHYLNTAKVQKAIGAYVNFTSASSTVQTTFSTTGDDARVLSINDDLRSLVKRGISVALYFGDSDYVCNWVGGEAVADALGIEGYDEAGYVDFETSDDIVHGQVKQTDNFAFIRIYQSGHMVPFFKPLLALEMLQRAADDLDFATGTMKDFSGTTEGPRRSLYSEGNATVQWSVVPESAAYNIFTSMPNPWNTTTTATKVSQPSMKRSIRRNIGFPSWRSWVR